MKKCYITVKDEVYAVVSGLLPQDQEFLENKFAYMVEGAFWMPLYKLGVWDGKVKFFDANGKIFLRLLDEVCAYLDGWNYEIIIQDERRIVSKCEVRITENWFIKSEDQPIKIKLRPYQVEAANLMLEKGDGIVLAATGAGKTLLVAAVCDAFGTDNKKCIVIVPSVDLVDQTAATFKLCDVDVGKYGGSGKDLAHTHVISTWQSLQNNPAIIQDFDVVIIDECVHPNTKITTINGEVDIKDLKIGELVLTINEETQKREFKPIVKIHKNLLKSSNEKRLAIKLDNGREIIITGNHNIMTASGWKRADELTVNDELV